MYIWKFETMVKWTYHPKDEEGDREYFTVASMTFEDAWGKLQKIALDKSTRKFVNDEDGKTYFPKSVLLIEGSRGSWLDG